MADPQETPVEHDSPDAQILVLRNDQTDALETVEATPDARDKARKGAQERKAIFEYRKTGADARAGKLPRLLTAAYAAGTTNLMLAKLLNEDLVPASAKEAADIAKITHAIYREASGNSPGNANLTPVERAQRMSEIDVLESSLKERAEEATAQLGGAPPAGEPVDLLLEPPPPSQWEHDAEPD